MYRNYRVCCMYSHSSGSSHFSLKKKYPRNIHTGWNYHQLSIFSVKLVVLASNNKHSNFNIYNTEIRLNIDTYSVFTISNHNFSSRYYPYGFLIPLKLLLKYKTSKLIHLQDARPHCFSYYIHKSVKWY